MIKFEWNERKNQLNIGKHELDFIDACEMFKAPMLICKDVRNDYLEDRCIGIGHVKNRLMVVVYTERYENIIRIISFRKANKREQKRFAPALKNELGKG